MPKESLNLNQPVFAGRRLIGYSMWGLALLVALITLSKGDAEEGALGGYVTAAVMALIGLLASGLQRVARVERSSATFIHGWSLFGLTRSHQVSLSSIREVSSREVVRGTEQQSRRVHLVELELSSGDRILVSEEQRGADARQTVRALTEFLEEGNRT